MEKFEPVFGSLPLKIPIWSVSPFKRLTSKVNRFDAGEFVDFGGAGVYVEPMKDEIHFLKADNMLEIPFVARAPTLPLRFGPGKVLCRKDLKHRRTFKPLNRLAYDKQLKLVVSVNCTRNTLLVDNLKENKRKKAGLNRYSVKAQPRLEFNHLRKSNGPVVELSEPRVFGAKRCLTVQQLRGVEVVEICTDEDAVELKGCCQVDASVCPNYKKIDRLKYQIQRCSRNSLLHQRLVLGIKQKQGNKEVGHVCEYDVEAKKSRWYVGPETNLECDMGRMISLYYCKNHPTLVAYTEPSQAGLFDTRLEPESCYAVKTVLEKIKTVDHWELVRESISNPTDPNQHLILTDHHMLLLDVRYPNSSLLQWNHMLNLEDCCLHSSNTLSSKENSCHCIAISNEKSICLFTLKEPPPRFVQPTALHPPIHISEIMDTYLFADLDYRAKRDFSNYEIIGISVVNSDSGFSVAQLTNNGDLFAQDFYSKEDTQHEDFDHPSWRYSVDGVLSLDEGTIKHIKRVYKSAEVDKSEEVDYLLSFNRSSDCDCCSETWFHRECEETKDLQLKSGVSAQEILEDEEICGDGGAFANRMENLTACFPKKLKRRKVADALESVKEFEYDEDMDPREIVSQRVAALWFDLLDT